MTERIRKITQNTDLMESLMVGVSTIVGSVFSYLLQFVLGRKLSIEDYGTFNALLSLSTIIGVLSAVFATSIIKVVAEMSASDDKNKINFLYSRIIKFSVMIGFIIFFIIFLSKSFISADLKISDSFLVLLFAITVSLSFVVLLPSSFMQGMQRFRDYSIMQIVIPFVRFLIPVIFLFLGFGLRGVFGGLPLASLVSFLVGFFMLNIGFKGLKKINIDDYYKKLLTFGISFLAVNFCMSALSNIDLIMVKKYLSPTDAGYYAGAVTLGKILLFGSGAFSVIMFPKITALYAEGKYFLTKLKKILLMLLLVLFVGVMCYWIFPGFITQIFFGKTFANSISLLPPFSIFVAFYVLINFFVAFFLAVDKKRVGFLLLPGVIIQYIFLTIFHESLFDVIKVNIGVSFLTIVLLLIYFYISLPDLRNVKKAHFEEVLEIPSSGI